MMFRLFTVFFLGALCVGAESSPYKIGKFPQEVGHLYGEKEGLPSGKVFRIIVTSSGKILASTEHGVAVRDGGDWSTLPGTEDRNIWALCALGDRVFASGGKASNELYELTGDTIRTVLTLEEGNGIRAVAALGEKLFVASYREASEVRILSLAGEVHSVMVEEAAGPAGVRSGFAEFGIDADRNAVSVALEYGAYFLHKDELWLPRDVRYDSQNSFVPHHLMAYTTDSNGNYWLGVGEVPRRVVKVARNNDNEFYTGHEGLPVDTLTCAAPGPDGEVWFGSRDGAIRFDGEHWNYRQGKAWLPSDYVNDIAVDAQGGAWIATEKGIGYIERRMMTLAEKAEYYEQEVEKYIKRTPFGYTSEVGLAKAGDRSSEILRDDSDNDGLWTSMYGAGECYAYGATKSPLAKERAKTAFEALRFLQKVTQGGEHSPPKGYTARTIRDINDPDPNIGRIEGDREKVKEDKRWKVYEPRWPKSADGQWYWKSDTSSDELDGHYFFYPLYHDLVADTEEEKERVREVVRDLTDHMIAHDFALLDVDGTKSRWAVYGPDDINRDQYWWPERGLNSLSMLAYLAVAEHVTGDTKYSEVARELIDKHHYLQNLNYPKFQWGPGTGNQSDDEMAVMSFYNLIRYTKDDEVREVARYAFYRYWIVEFPEMNPFFNFAYAAVGLDKEVTDNWGTWSITPLEGWLDDSMATLTGFPLDRCNWAKKNSHRIDLKYLILDHNREPYEADGRGRGYRVNDKVLPVEERFFNHYNTDPWALDYGGDGRGLASGAVFTLPYFMGLYHGFIEETK